MLKGGGGGGTSSFEVVLTRELEVLAILKGRAKRGRGTNSFTLPKSFGPAIFPFCSPSPLPIINDQFLSDIVTKHSMALD